MPSSRKIRKYRKRKSRPRRKICRKRKSRRTHRFGSHKALAFRIEKTSSRSRKRHRFAMLKIPTYLDKDGGPRIDYTARAKKVRHMKEQRRLWVEYGKPELKKFNAKLKIVAGNKRYTLDALKNLTPDNRKKILAKAKKNIVAGVIQKRRRQIIAAFRAADKKIKSSQASESKIVESRDSESKTRDSRISENQVAAEASNIEKQINLLEQQMQLLKFPREERAREIETLVNKISDVNKQAGGNDPLEEALIASISKMKI